MFGAVRSLGELGLGLGLAPSIDTGLGIVNIIHPLLDDTDWPDLTERAQQMTRRLLQDAREAAIVGPNFIDADITYTSIRFARPLAIGLRPETEAELAHRQLDIYLDGLEVATNARQQIRSRER